MQSGYRQQMRKAGVTHCRHIGLSQSRLIANDKRDGKGTTFIRQDSRNPSANPLTQAISPITEPGRGLKACPTGRRIDMARNIGKADTIDAGEESLASKIERAGNGGPRGGGKSCKPACRKTKLPIPCTY